MSTEIVLPGTPLAPADKATPGSNTHIHNGQIVSSILGQALTSRTNSIDNSTGRSKSKQINTVSVTRPSPPYARNAPVLPAVGSQVYVKITALQRTQAICEIRVICPPTAAALPSLASSSQQASAPSAAAAAHALSTSFRGIIRSQDVRATEKDKVKLGECFRVGDIVRAVVISLGDQGGYYLSTAGNEYGVVMAWSEGAGNLCVPVSWCEVVDEVTGKREQRKVAKPI